MAKDLNKFRQELKEMGITPQIVDLLFPSQPIKPVLKIVNDKKNQE